VCAADGRPAAAAAAVHLAVGMWRKPSALHWNVLPCIPLALTRYACFVVRTKNLLCATYIRTYNHTASAVP
jgi:hypothetical protein